MALTVKLTASAIVIMLAATLLGCPGGDTPPGNQQQTPAQTNGQAPATSLTVWFETSDGHAIVGTLIEPQGDTPKPACLLVHMLGHDRSTYDELQQRLADEDTTSLAIDLRGHGQSTDRGMLDFRNFTRDEEWQDMVKDIRGGLDYLAEQGYTNGRRVGIVGASIGANLAVIAAADLASETGSQQVACLVLLSPGLSYHNVEPLPRAHDLDHTPVLIVSATADAQSYSGSEALSQAARGGELRSVSGRAHGTNMFNADESLMDEIVDFLKQNLAAAEPTEEPTPGGES